MDSVVGFLAAIIYKGNSIGDQEVSQLAEVRFVTAVTVAGSVKFFASGVNFSNNTHFLGFYH